MLWWGVRYGFCWYNFKRSQARMNAALLIPNLHKVRTKMNARRIQSHNLTNLKNSFPKNSTDVRTLGENRLLKKIEMFQKKITTRSTYMVNIIFPITRYTECKSAWISDKHYTVNLRQFCKNQNNMIFICWVIKG